MPCVASPDAFHRAIAEFVVIDLDLVIEPSALAAALRSLDSSGLLLLGEIHGVLENSYGGGSFYNCESRQFARHVGSQGKTRLHQHQGELVLDLPLATEAVVPQRPLP